MAFQQCCSSFCVLLSAIVDLMQIENNQPAVQAFFSGARMFCSRKGHTLRVTSFTLPNFLRHNIKDRLLSERNVYFRPLRGLASYEVASNKFQLFVFKSRNQRQHVARLDNIFSRPRPGLSRLRRPGAVSQSIALRRGTTIYELYRYAPL